MVVDVDEVLVDCVDLGVFFVVVVVVLLLTEISL